MPDPPERAKSDDTVGEVVHLAEDGDLKTAWVYLQALEELVGVLKRDVETLMRAEGLGDERSRNLLQTGIEALHHWAEKLQ